MIVGLYGTRGGKLPLPGGTVGGSGGNAADLAYGLCAGNGKVMGYGSSTFGAMNAVISADDGITWSVSNRPGDVNDTAFINSLFISWESSLGNMVTSPDGVTWTTIATTGGPNGSTYFEDLIWDGSKYVAVAKDAPNQGVYTSTTLATWTRVSTIAANNIAFLSGIYVAVDSSGVASSSTDLITWTPILTGLSTKQSVSVANGRFFVSANGTLAHSTDGASWATVSGFGPFHEVIYGNSLYYFCGTSSLDQDYVSTNLTSVSTVAFGAPQTDWFYNRGFKRVACFTGTRFVVGRGSNQFYYSTDCVTWNNFYDGFLPDYYDGNGSFGVGFCDAAASSGNKLVRCLGYDNSSGLEVGLYGDILDGETLRTSGTTAHLFGVAYNGSAYVVVGAGGIVLRSTDKITWTAAATLGGNLRYVIWSADVSLFIAVGDGGVIYTSPTGVTWTARTSNTSSKLNRVRQTTHATHKFVAVGENSTVCYSTNGTTWNAITISYEWGADLISLKDVDYGLGIFVLGDGFRAANLTDPFVYTLGVNYINAIRFNGTAFKLYGRYRSNQTMS